MNQLLLATLIVLFVATGSAMATNVHECEDEHGNKTFQKFCPPGSKSLNQKEYSGGPSKAKKAVDLPALVLYRVPDCEVCDQVQGFLDNNKLSAKAVNVKDDGVLQEELRSKTGGELRVPILLVGERVVKGYDENNLTIALTEAGYLEKDEIEGPE